MFVLKAILLFFFMILNIFVSLVDSCHVYKFHFRKTFIHAPEMGYRIKTIDATLSKIHDENSPLKAIYEYRNIDSEELNMHKYYL